MAKAEILIVEDDAVVAKDIQNRLKNLGFDVCASVPSGEEALEEAQEHKPDLVLMDIMLKGEMNGTEAARQIHSQFDIPVVYLTAYADEKVLERAKVTEPFGYIMKPFEDRELNAAVEIALYRHKIEKKLKESEEWLSTTLNSIGDAVIATDKEGHLTFMNPVAESLTGWQQGEAKGKPLKDVFNIINEETREEVENPVAKVLREGTVVGLANHTVLIAKDGKDIPVDHSGSPIRDEKGDITGVVLVFRDVRGRREGEEALRESEERYGALFDRSLDCIYIHDFEGNFIDANPAALNLLGYKKEEIPSVNFATLLSPDQIPNALERLEEVKRIGFDRTLQEFRLKRKDGKFMDVEAISALIYRDGKPYAIQGIARDITIRKQSEEALRESEEKYRTIIENIVDAYYEVDLAGNLTFFNDSACEITGLTRDELMGMNNREYMDEETAKKVYEVYNGVYNTGRSVKGFEYEIISPKDGSRIYVESSLSLIKNPEGQPAGFRGILRDTTERKQAEEVLRQSEQRFREMAALLPDIICEMNMNLHLTYVNTAGFETFGYTQDEFDAGINGMDLIHPDYGEKAAKHIKDISKGIGVVSTEYRMLKKDGSEIIALLSGAPIYKDDQVVGIRVSATDITERKQAEEALRYLKEYNEKIVASIPSSLLVLDKNLNIKSVNRTYLDTGGIEEEDVVGRNIKEVFPGHLLKEGGLLKAFEEVMETKEPCRLHNVRHTSTHHPEKILNFTVSGIHVAEEEEEEEEEATLILIIEDITQRARLREEIRKSRDFMDTIFKTSVDIVVTTDESGIITFVNRAIERIAGYKEEELIGRHVSELYDKGRERAKDIMGILTSGQALKSYILRLLAKQGKEIPISISGSLLKDSQGRVIGTLGFIRDVSRLVEAEEELRKKNEELENFVYVVSHDLKSPIVSMQGFSSMLLNDYGEKLGEKGERYLERIRANASRMEVLISDLLALSRVGRVVGAFKDVPSLEIISRVCKGLKSRIGENRIEVSIGDNLPAIRCDGDRIYQVFENLVVNAIKFMGDTQEPRIEIGYEEKGEFHQFHVRDNGIGIDPNYHSKIFEIFQRLREIEDAEGTGIGLVIVERIIKNHGGEVWVESEKGKGATFCFTLPKAG